MTGVSGDRSLLYTTIFRSGRGTARLELVDAESKQLLRVPEGLVEEVVKVVPDLDLAARALGNLAAISHSYTFSMPRPAATDRLFAEGFISRLVGKLPVEEQRSVGRDDLSPRELEMEIGEALDWVHLKWCLELGLHQWTRIVHTSRWRCAVCGGRAESLLPKEEPFQQILRVLLTADPWRLTTDRSYERFERLRAESPPLPEFRIVVDSLLLEDSNPYQETSAENVILGLGPRIDGISIFTPVKERDPLPEWANVLRAELRQSEDVNGVAHEHAYVPRGDGAQPIELGEVTEISQLARRLDNSGRGNVLARTLLIGNEFGHATITTDTELLRLEDRRAHLVMTPRAGSVLVGIFARYMDYVPVGPHRINSEYFYEDRAFVLAPAISDFIQDVAASVDKGAFDSRVLRLAWSIVERFGLLARAEDEIAFRLFLERGGRRDVIYHFDYLLLLARAVIEGLGEIAATLHDVTRPNRPEQTLSWKELLKTLKQAQSPAANLIAPGTKGYMFSELISTLRNPLAHAERWQTADSGLGATVWISGTDAEVISRCISGLESDPSAWGLRGMRMENGELELSLDPYPFAVHLNMHLLSVTEAFLGALSLGTQLLTSSKRQPWEMTNPPLDQRAFGVIATMTWPMPGVNWMPPAT